MVSTSIIHLTGKASTAVDEAVATLVSMETLNGRYRISMPVAMCTGTLVDVSVWPEPDGDFMVSDDGVAHFEIASNSISQRTFNSVARAKCAPYGAVFDGGAMFFMRVAADRLRGAIIAMAALVKDVVDETMERAAKAKADAARDILFARLDSAFSAPNVIHDADILGASTAGYTVDAIVQTDAGPVVYDLFTKDANSVSSAFTKLSDISRLDTGPRLVAVTREPDLVGPKLQLIATVAPIIRLTSAPETFRKAAIAA